MKFIFPAPHPKYVHPPGTTFNFFHLRVNPGFWQKKFKTPCVPNVCIYRSDFLSREQQGLEVSFDAILGKIVFLKILPLNPKGKVALGSFLGPIFKRKKKTFLTWYETSSKHHRRCLKVQRTCLKPFLTSEGHLGRKKSRGRLWEKIVIFWRFFQAGVPMCANTFWWGARPGGVPKGHASVRKVVRPRSDT